MLDQPTFVAFKAFIQKVLDQGETYPHHGLYFITSEKWDLEVLGGLLLSDIAELFAANCSVKCAVFTTDSKRSTYDASAFTRQPR